MTIVSVNNK